LRSSAVTRRILSIVLKNEVADGLLVQLRAAGHAVHTAEDLESARRLLASGGLDQVILPAALLAPLLERQSPWQAPDHDDWRRSTAGLTHDLRTVLDTLERGIQEWQLKEEDKADPLESIRRMISALSAFLYELTLEMSNGASKELHLAVIDLEDSVEAAAMTVYPMASDKQLRLVVDIDGEVARICWDRTKLKRVLAKLLDDAVRKTPHSGTVTIRAHREDERCVISVSDGGQGTRQLPFQRFFDPYARPEGGVGPGLALAKELVALHGGDVRVESRAGSGTTVFLSLVRSLDEGPEPPGGSIAERQ